MKRKLLYVLIFCMTISNLTVYGEKWETGKKADAAIQNLEFLDVVRNPEERWNEESYITRRDAFMIAYIIKNNPYFATGKPIRRQYCMEIDPADPDLAKEIYQKELEAYAQYDVNIDFVDLVPEDMALASSLAYLALIAGREEGGKLYAAFDAHLTYQEALATIIRVLGEQSFGVCFSAYTPLPGNSFYDIGLRLGLITQEEQRPDELKPIYRDLGGPVSQSARAIYCAPEMLKQEIRAYEYLRLVYASLFIERRLYYDNLDVIESTLDLLLSEHLSPKETGTEDIKI